MMFSCLKRQTGSFVENYRDDLIKLLEEWANNPGQEAVAVHLAGIIQALLIEEMHIKKEIF